MDEEKRAGATEEKQEAEVCVCFLGCPWTTGAKLGDKVLCMGHWTSPKKECPFFTEWEKNQKREQKQDAGGDADKNSAFWPSFNSPFGK